MPDQNKLKVLHEAGFKVKETCFRCQHFDKDKPAPRRWGECDFLHYNHLKHDNPPEGRKVSVPMDGWCPNFKLDEYMVVPELGAYRQFLESQS